jgi:hypothetical protein
MHYGSYKVGSNALLLDTKLILILVLLVCDALTGCNLLPVINFEYSNALLVLNRIYYRATTITGLLPVIPVGRAP